MPRDTRQPRDQACAIARRADTRPCLHSHRPRPLFVPSRAAVAAVAAVAGAQLPKVPHPAVRGQGQGGRLPGDIPRLPRPPRAHGRRVRAARREGRARRAGEKRWWRPRA
eukprot:824269-Prymnesium_polylepis.1